MIPIYHSVQPKDKQMSNAEVKNQSIGSSSPYLDSIIGSYMTNDHIPGLSAETGLLHLSFYVHALPGIRVLRQTVMLLHQ